MLKPLFGNVMIELVDDFAGIQRADGNEQLMKGIVRDWALMDDHLTTSVGYEIKGLDKYDHKLARLNDKTVYYQQYADSGTKIEYDGKTYVFVPFYRLIAVED